MAQSDIAIRVEGLSKRYLIGHDNSAARGHETLRDALVRNVGQIGRTALEMARGRPIIQGDEIEEFWALRDVSFDVARGEVIGIVGRNGAGKSTLLKILSRITDPSEGRVTVNGRVASLLEVGTGFHPELTGRENIYLNGAILGMGRAEVKAKFDEIVAFAEVERFLDTPVKRYSSGMYVRLAFSVAAHLEPEILIVDEVLAVGDADFQKKCLGKMQSVAGHGRTVLFVSHNMNAISTLCSRAVLLRGGSLEDEGPAGEVVARYMQQGRLRQAVKGERISAFGTVEQETYDFGPGTVLAFDITLTGPIERPSISLGVNDVEGRRIATLATETAVPLPPVAAGETLAVTVRSEPLRLAPGQLYVKVALDDKGREVEAHEDAVVLVVPNYLPFVQVPDVRPRGVIMVRPTVTIRPAESTLEAGDLPASRRGRRQAR